MVIAVVGILESLLLPALARSRVTAKRIHCAGNVRQLILEVHLYANDNLDWLLPHLQNIWMGTNLFQCVDNSRLQDVLSSHHGLGNRVNGRSLFNFAYGWNVEVEKVNNSRFIKFDLLVSPSDHIQLEDTAGWFRNNVPDFLMNSIVNHVPYRSNSYVFDLTRRHSGMSNMDFSDRHVKHGSLRFWTLPVESVHRRWHYDGKAHLDRLAYPDAENWAPFRGINEELPPKD